MTDPFDSDNDNASTQAVDMSQVHEGIQRLQQSGQLGDVPGLPQASQNAPQQAQQPQRQQARSQDRAQNAKQANPDDPGVRPSGIMAAVGGALVFISFFFGWLSGAPMFKNNDILDKLDNQYGPRELFSEDFDLEKVPEEQREAIEVALSVFEALGLDDYIVEMTEAEDRDARKEIARNYLITPLGAARALMTIDLNVKDLIDDFDEGNKEAKEALAGIRGTWLTLFALWIAALLALAHAAARRFRPLSTPQIAWNGVVGLLLLAIAAALIGVDETEKVMGENIPIFAGVGRFILAGGALVLWFSAFAGLSKRNWWKAPLLGLGVLVLLGAVVGLPVFMALN